MAKRQLISGNKLERGIHSLLQNYAVLYAFLLVTERIFLLKILEDSGMGYLALPMDIFLIALFGIAFPLFKTVSGLMKVYIRRSQMKNAYKVGNIGFGYAFLLALLSALLVFLLKQKIANTFQVPLCWIIMLCSAAAIFFSFLGAGAKSFIAGVSADVFIIIGNAMEVILLLVGSFLGAYIGNARGMKVKELLRFPELQYVYAGAGVMVGIAIAQAITCLYWCVIYFITRQALSVHLKEDQTRRTEETRTMAFRIGTNMLPTSVLSLLSQGMLLVGQWLYLRHIPEGETSEKMIAYWGCFYGKYLPFIMIPASICVIVMYKNLKKIMVFYDNEEGRQLREEVQRALIKMNAVTFTGAVMIAVLGQAYLEGLCGGMVTSILKVVQTMSVVVVAYGYYYCSHALLQRMQYHGDSLMISVVSLVVTLLISFLLLSKNGQNLLTPAMILAFYFGIAGALGLLRLYRKLRCSVNWMKTFAYPLFCSCISGLVVMLLGRGFGQLIGPVMTLILGAFIGLFVEVFTLLAFHVINENQASYIPFGKLVCYIAGAIGFR